MSHLVHLSQLAAASAGTPVFADVAFATPWRRLDCVLLGPGQRYSPRPQEEVEEGYVVLGGTAVLSTGSVEVEAEGPVLLRCGSVREHEVANAGRQPLSLLYMQVALSQDVASPPSRGSAGAPAFPEAHAPTVVVEAASAMGSQPVPPSRSPGGGAAGAATQGPVVLAEAVDRARLEWRPAIHGGVGRIASRHIWGPHDFRSSWTFADHAALDARSSLGYHCHEALEECFVVLAGRAHITIGGRTFAAGPGDVTWQGIGQAHGVYNPHPEGFEFLRLAVRQTGAHFTTVDLHEDLVDRLPDDDLARTENDEWGTDER